MGFTDLSTPAGLQNLEKHLADKSYVEGSAASQADVAVFNDIAPSAEQYPNIARWFKHIASYVPEFSTLPGDKNAKASTVGGAAAAPAAADEEDDDDVDLFGSDDEEDEEAERIKAERVAEYNKRKAGKPKAAAKSMVTLEVKPWDDETPLEEMLKSVKSIEMDGLLWGASKWVPIGYGIQKLQINCVIEDEKVSLDELQEQIQEMEDYVQSTDVAAMQKI